VAITNGEIFSSPIIEDAVLEAMGLKSPPPRNEVNKELLEKFQEAVISTSKSLSSAFFVGMLKIDSEMLANKNKLMVPDDLWCESCHGQITFILNHFDLPEGWSLLDAPRVVFYFMGQCGTCGKYYYAFGAREFCEPHILLAIIIERSLLYKLRKGIEAAKQSAYMLKYYLTAHEKTCGMTLQQAILHWMKASK